ncbi:hypothetical protein TSH58p_12440 [Azospirillum sp. TSH58]|uniref:hypothetical protein n=1 Tax=Azospirillum sp. TSH58 TaxID=664962 RepID=UPI000D5FEDFD|nr:hypothetical protein [Azospirillum sp. TSH58]AWJ84263.1 hypothetical protein TSH58p_12440 [Azospirillum sp. TSH58]PWC59724.1 hypothetical protein TSH58_29365 [Azospirillum sp. TSH58]
MRAFDGQHSDNVAIKRTREQKQLQLQQLKEQLATLKSHAAPAIREALMKRIAELEVEMRQPPKPPREGRGDGPRGEGRGPRGDGPRGDRPRREGFSRSESFRSDGPRGDGPRGDGPLSPFASPRRRG